MAKGKVKEDEAAKAASTEETAAEATTDTEPTAAETDEPKVAKPENVDADIITVKSGLKGNRVALWEENPEHPGGEVYIAGDKPVRVARTSEVAKRLRDGTLVEV